MTRLALFLLPALLCLTGCQREEQLGSGETLVEKANREGVLIMGNSNEPKGLDSQVVTGVLESNILRALFEGLVSDHPSEDATVLPAGAEVLEPDATATVWTAKLRQDAKWSDGAPVTAHDYAFAYQRILEPSFAAKYAEMLYFLKGADRFNKGETTDFKEVGVEVLDDFTLRLTLRGPTPYFPQILKHYTWNPVPRHAVLKYGTMTQKGNAWSKLGNIVSNGPYQLKSWRRNDHLEVERNPYYWGADKVTLNGVRFLPINNSYTEARMFRDGLMHVTYTAPPEIVDFMKKENPSVLRQEPYVGTLFFRCNTKRKPLDDQRVRRALNLAYNQEEICNKILRGYKPAYGMTPPMAGYDSPHAISFDPETARRLLAEAGFPGGKGFPRLKILLASRETAATVAQAVQAMWRKELGIEVEIENKEWTAYLAAMQEFDYDLASSGWIGDYLDPLTFLEMWTDGNGNNLTGWSSKPYEELLQKSHQEADAAKRYALLREAETIMTAESPTLLIAWYARNYLMDPAVEGWKPLLLDNHPYDVLRLRTK
ncbi:peptide ABC transporter substrate-binding protein [Luteolibacter sp. GHJ8]|uniref:Peptide ABC transporter substrate-binding protein n=1 Tax=Luteolibacter rhizosphaerae TaxID=2989719 RepID=A0ABT3G832_9BACT|nr:peptide ABC transporter substrate-binding protein [Luteolibacter rhizosphaerae]MCW1916018.1 peptide ABC transporter substrate-binding protein [Luteolibacter rhizosphaerae]